MVFAIRIGYGRFLSAKGLGGMDGNSVVTLPGELKPDGRNTLVRLGSRHDGGYIVAAALLGDLEHLLSFGLGLNWDFEHDVERYTSVREIACYDHTVGRRYYARKLAKAYFSYVINPARYGDRITRCRDYFAWFDGRKVVHYPLKVGATDGPRATTVDAALRRLDGAGNRIFLKCDIEGSEFEIGDAIVAAAPRFSGIAIEFHDLDTRSGEMLKLVRALKQTHFLDHVHVNNAAPFVEGGFPSVIEISMSRRDIPGEVDLEWLASVGLGHSRNGEALDASTLPRKQDVRIRYV